jgi:hypothetical protein
MPHLLLECPFSKQICHETLSCLVRTFIIPNNDTSPLDWLTDAKLATPKPLCKRFCTVALLLPWMIWEHRNDCIFEEAQPSASHLMARIKEGTALWTQAVAIGPRAALPTTWDVH